VVDETVRYALTISVVASAVGGIVLCALILKYGLVPPEEDEHPPLARRRVFVIRTGHAVAAVCFAVTAVMAVVALSRPPAATGGGATEEQLRRLERDVRALDTRLASVEDVLERVGGAVDELAARLDPSASPGLPPAPPRRRAPAP